jgi:hypothetical protein
VTDMMARPHRERKLWLALGEVPGCSCRSFAQGVCHRPGWRPANILSFLRAESRVKAKPTTVSSELGTERGDGAEQA